MPPMNLLRFKPQPAGLQVKRANHQTTATPYSFYVLAEKEGYNELFSDGYNPNHDDLDLHLTDDEDDEEGDGPFGAKSRESNASSARSR